MRQTIDADDDLDGAFLPALRVDANAKCHAVATRYGTLEPDLLRRLAAQQSADAMRLAHLAQTTDSGRTAQ